jgi:hypothetical protein
MPFFFARGLLGVVMVSAALGFALDLYRASSGASIRRNIDAQFGARVPEALAEPAAHASIGWDGTVSVSLADPGASLALVNALPTLVAAGAAAVVGWLLFIVVIDVQRGVPFEARAAARLQTAAGIIACASVAYTALSAWADSRVFEAAVDGGRMARSANVAPDVFDPLPWLLVAALTAVAARVFREGRRLADETEGLV